MAKRKKRRHKRSSKSKNDYSFLFFLIIIAIIVIVICLLPKNEIIKNSKESNSLKQSNKVVSNTKASNNNKKVNSNISSNKEINSKKEETKKEETKKEVKDDYKVYYDEENENLEHGITIKTEKAVVKNGAKDEVAKKITKYLDDVIDSAKKSYKESASEAKENEGYTFDYKYSLYDETDKYLVFELDYTWQAGGPYPTSSSEYYMFNKSNGNIIEFDDLFTKDIKNKVKENIVKKINEIYDKQNDEYSDELSNDVFIVGFYVLKNGKLKFILPRGYFTAAAYGSLTINIDENIYKDYIK